MAYTPTPNYDTYSAKRFPLATDIHFRPGLIYSLNSLGIDAGMVNVLPFKEGQEVVAETRAAIWSRAVWPAGNMRGMYIWEKFPGFVYHFAVIDNKVYSALDGVTFTLVNTLTTGGVVTPVRFTEFIDDVNVKKLILVDGVQGIVFTDNTAGTPIADPDFPTPHIPFPVFLDGRIFLAKKNTGDIYNSNLNDPALWTAGDFISSEMAPDDLQALAKINNYVVAIGTQSIEYFYDAANDMASPLARVENAALPIGTMLPNSIATNHNTIMMVANRNDGAPVIAVIENQAFTEVDPNVAIGLMTRDLVNYTIASEVRGYFFRQRGHLFYGISFNYSEGIEISNKTFVYCLETKIWTEFRYGTGLAYPVQFTAPTNTQSLNSYVGGQTATHAFIGGIFEGYIVPPANNGVDIINSVSTPIYQEIRTSNLDFGTMNIKQMHRLALGVEYISRAVTLTAAKATISVTWSDDDFYTYQSSSLVGLNDTDGATGVASAYAPFITQLGTFRRRQFKFISDAGQLIRWKFYECDINKGTR